MSFDGWRNFRIQLCKSINWTTDNFTRLSVEQDKDYLYLFTDNVLRNSGRNLVDKNSLYYNRFNAFHKGKCHYPSRTQACIRGLQNACPISTMYDGHKHQLMGNMSLESMINK